MELFGESGARELAKRMGVPERTWLHYESGVTFPAELMLLFLEVTSVEPRWLLHGRGPQYRWGEGLSTFGFGKG